MSPWYIALIVVVALVLSHLAVRITKQHERGVALRFGRTLQLRHLQALRPGAGRSPDSSATLLKG